MPNINANEIIDHARLKPIHWRVILLSALIIIFDGYDLVIYGVALPKLMQEWQIDTITAGFLGSVALFGMMFGAIIFGSLSDKLESYGFSRKKLIVLCIIFFSGFTLSCSYATNPQSFGIFRFLAGLGLGGVMPNVIALMTEYAPKKLRATLVSLMFSGYAVGGMCSALLGIWLVPQFGWKIMFMMGGLPLLLLPLIWYLLPESIDYLVRRKNTEEAFKILKQIDNSLTYNNQMQISLHNENQAVSKSPVKDLFAENRGSVTLLFWTSVFMALILVYALGNWLPKLMVEAGYDLSTSLVFLFALNIGGMLGAIFGGYLADRFNLAKVLCTLFASGAIALFLLSYSLPTFILYMCIAVAGAASIGGQILLLAYMSQYYSSNIRATGLGMALGVGRLGAILGPILCGWLLSLSLPLTYNFIALAIPCMIAVISVSMINYYLKQKKSKAEIVQAQ
ncbi:MFS transporter [Acinetobacter baumannii]|jgi:AAHS family benzoate transporter-like MFS transporter|uniref:MFS transporter n=2 Tax=Acinetobacter TaxID=469 RepID=A0AAW5RAE2_ACIJU|nr:MULTISPECIES: aromatic acid/H+ symport family MFS transporter [Acinetobacter]EHZ7896969.1 MFS transporter [Acinetobacter baumannii]EKD3138701.1 MFS transporter [Acinetobacter baumannii]EKT8006401.1 MFS transporter [Acinetobacter baumannii]EKT8249395.1 MFS transporter [Acinetobacter baumannii]EKT8295457.1 MFS transporter [Acinetobacter baumannii]